ncbi:Gfo/Idh/MocA family protein [Gracilibacillus dipsosauri]|uniref:Gfo/Idh/MocA family oxidoreductase n=1 Tax=Gracilibacillus dipsosauri TaxID=178340 RepID=A0A317L0Z4_9BACI|nr:Gfo/Idh/MocA family oxidoreductase [Gracilibacillus dipsosauri]PWU69491.1 gfo/Idh/MocA family oxidoreductase [Gracilibacillus dipsosauri]
MLNVGIIGLGDISSIHLKSIQAMEDARLAAVCDLDLSQKERFDGIPFYSDFAKMLTEQPLDCVHICLPHHLHYLATKTAVEAGVHVLLEKPLAHSIQDAKAIVELEENHPNIKIGVCLQNRLNETVKALQQMVSSKKYGQIIGLKGLVTWHRPKAYYDAKPWRGFLKTAGGGVMINQAIHTLDLIQLVGGEIESIRGSIDQLLDYEYDIEDTATAYIKFNNGATGLFFATVSNAQNSSIEFQVMLEKAILTIKDSILTITTEDGQKKRVTEDTKLPGSKFYYGASHAKLIAHFYQEILGGTCDYIHVRDAFVSMEMIQLIRNSSEAKKPITMEVFQ